MIRKRILTANNSSISSKLLPLVSGTTRMTKIVPHKAMNPMTNPSLAPRLSPGVRMRYGTMRMNTNRIMISVQVQKLMTIIVSPKIEQK
jgi:hypothetical protein